MHIPNRVNIVVVSIALVYIFKVVVCYILIPERVILDCFFLLRRIHTYPHIMGVTRIIPTNSAIGKMIEDNKPPIAILLLSNPLLVMELVR